LKSPASRLWFAASTILAMASPSLAGFLSREVFLPAVGRISGQGGAQFYTTVWVTNPSGSRTIHVTFQFLKQGQGNATGAPSFADTLAPGETKIYENVVEEKLHLSNAIGAGRIIADGEILASERIFNQAHASDDLGTTEGLFFAAVPSSAAIGLGEQTTVQGVNQGNPSQDMRTNFALVETAGSPATAHVSLVNDLGAVVGSADFPLQPYEQIQPNVAALFSAVSTINARLVATVTAGSGRVIIAGAQLANTSQDSSGFQMSFPAPLFRAGPPIAITSEPSATLAFDGANVWVADISSNSVQRISIATGVAGPPIPVGNTPEGLAFDGTSVWVSNAGDGTVQKIPVATGVPGPPIAVGAEPSPLAFDRANIWVANEIDGTLQKIPVATGVPGAPIHVGRGPIALVFDGANIWVANSIDNTVQKVPTATGVPDSPIAVAGSPWALAFDGSSVWVANLRGGVQKIPVATGVPGPPLLAAEGAVAIAFDGANVWVAESNALRTIAVATGVTGPPIPVGIDPLALVFDGTDMWVASRHDHTVQEVGPAIPSDVFLPAVGRVTGQGGAQFYTTIWATNPSGRTIHLTFRFLKQGQANDVNPPSFADVLSPGQTKIYENVVEDKFHLTSALGAGRITSDGEILVAERIYNQAHASDNLGTTEGLFFAGVPADLAIGSGETATIQGVNQGDASENMRTNFALVETTGHPATAHVALVNDLGAVIGSADFALQPYEQLQPNVAAVLPSVSTINARLVASVTAGTGKVILAGAQLANTSQDSSGFEMSFRDPEIGVGIVPIALAFDGTNVWVANGGDNTVQKIPVLTGIPGPPITVGRFPAALVFDGSSIWVANAGGTAGTVQKIPVSTGVPGPPIAVGGNPAGLAFDGQSIWVADEGGNTVRKIPVSTGVPGPPITIGTNPTGIAFDGTNVWVANDGDATVQKIPIATGIPGPAIGVGDQPVALVFDGSNIWVANFGDDTVQRIPKATGVAGAPIPVGSGPQGLAYDGSSVWVANYNDDTVQRVPVATGVPGPAIATGRNPDALVFDGANMWVANANGDSVQKEP
jgi:hypothetical protein